MTLMSENKGTVILGAEEPCAEIMEAYSEIVCAFLEDLSGWLRRDKEAAAYPDVLSVAFWCRRANIERMKRQFEDGKLHMGRGLLFHITPSNVPVNFAFSYFFGLLSGNSNIVRIPTKEFPQVKVLCHGIETILKKEEYEKLRKGTQFVTYEREREINDYHSNICDGRIIWGGDETIYNLRQSPMRSKAVEVVFADRYSFGVIRSEAVFEAAEEELEQLASLFYNDTYLMDQNACSTPHCIFWLGEKTKEAQKRFWDAVYKKADRYMLEDIKAVDKYTQLCHLAMERTDIANMDISSYGNRLYVVTMDTIPEDLETLRGKFGLFFQCDIEDLKQLKAVISPKSQTMLYYGLNKAEIQDFLKECALRGIDRAVPFGKALDMGVIWDGYDIIRSLSRVIPIE